MVIRKSVYVIAVCLILASLVSAYPADISGTWVGKAEGQGDGITLSIVLEAKETALTGNVTLTSPDGTIGTVPISEGKVDGNNVTFKAGPPNDLANVAGTLEGDELKLTFTTPKGDPIFTVTAKRKS